MIRTTLFKTNRSQAVRLPKDVAFPPNVHEVPVIREGARRIIVPTESIWDDFFDAPGIDLPERHQPNVQVRDPYLPPELLILPPTAPQSSWQGLSP